MYAPPPESPQVVPPEETRSPLPEISSPVQARPGKGWRRFLRLLVLSVTLWVLALLLTMGRHMGTSAPFEPELQRVRFGQRSSRNHNLINTAKSQIVLVPINDATIEDPLVAANDRAEVPRDRHARVVDVLSKAGAKCITFDILFDYPRKQDKEFAAAVRRARERGCQVIWAALWQSGEDLNEAGGKRLYLPNRTLLSASPLVGHSQFPVSSEFPVTERVQRDVKTEHKMLPALSIATFRAMEGKDAAKTLASIPMETDGTFSINYLVPPSADENVPPQIPYEEVYHGLKSETLQNFFRGKAVIIGDTTKLNHDYYRTPVNELPGMDIHAHVLTMLMTRSWIFYASPLAIAGIYAGIIWLMAGIGAVVRSWVAIVSGIILVGTYFTISIKLFCDSGLLLPTVAPILLGAFALVGAVAERSWFQDQAKARLDSVVNQYVSEQVSAEGAPRGTVTLVFSDIEDSSELSSHLGERFENVRADYFRLLREANKDHHGFEVETAGDSLFLVFQHAHDALEFAQAAQVAVREHRWPSRIQRLKIRIGVHTGKPYIRPDRTRLTYRGPDTNKAARVTAFASGDEVLLTQETLAAASVSKPGGFTYEDKGEVTLKGVGPTHLYSLPIP